MLNERLKELRENKNMTKKAVADQLKIHESTYGKYELGHREPDAATLKALADFYSVSIDYLLSNTDDPTPIEIQKPIPSDEDELSPKVRELDEKLKAVGIDISKLDTDTVNDIVTLIKIAKGK